MKKIVSLLIFFALIIGILSFQNCSQPKKEVFYAQESNQTTTTTGSTCLFDGNKFEEGQSVTAYKNSNVPNGSTCEVETRVCRSGAFTGSFSYASCGVDGMALCLFNGRSLNHNSSVTAYQNSSVPTGSQCVSQTRTCNNGILSGTYSYGQCQVAASSGCLFNGTTYANGEHVKAYQSSSVATGNTCAFEDRVCTNGVLSGSYAYSSCVVNGPAACLFNGNTILSGNSITAYSSSTVPFGQNCSTVAQTRTCTNGNLSGSFAYSTCSANTPASCLFNGLTIASGQNVPAFFTSTVPYGQSCTAELRTCTNGTLSGTASFAACEAQPMPSGGCAVNTEYSLDVCVTTDWQGDTAFQSFALNKDCTGASGTWSYTAPGRTGDIVFAWYDTCGTFKTTKALASGETMSLTGVRTTCEGSSNGGSTVYHYIDSIKCVGGKITNAVTRGTCSPSGVGTGYCSIGGGGGF